MNKNMVDKLEGQLKGKLLSFIFMHIIWHESEKKIIHSIDCTKKLEQILMSIQL